MYLTASIVAPLVLLLCHASLGKEHKAGHMQPFGSHRPADGPIDYLDEPPTPEVFWSEYVLRGRAVVIRGLAKNMPAAAMWTPEFVKDKYGDQIVQLERKREDSSLGRSKATFSEFYEQLTDDAYIVSQLPEAMANETLVPPVIMCGPIIDELVEVNLWMSTGNTKSLIHKDSLNQLNCLYDGIKNWTIIPVDHTSDVHLTWEGGENPKYASSGSSALNVDAVDLDQYPRISNVHYNHSQLFAGDCLYLPGGLLHQVNSLEGRNLAISILFTGPSAINAHYHPAETLKRWGAFKSNVPCEGKYAPVSTVDVAWMYKGDGIHTMGFLNPKVIRTALREFFSPSVKRLSRVDLARHVVSHLSEFIGTSPVFPVDDFDMIADALTFIDKRPRSEWQDMLQYSSTGQNAQIPGLRLKLLKEARDQAYAFFDSYAESEDGSVDGERFLTLDIVNGLRQRQIQDSLIIFIVVDQITSCFPFARGGPGGSQQSGDDEGDEEGEEEEGDDDYGRDDL